MEVDDLIPYLENCNFPGNDTGRQPGLINKKTWSEDSALNIKRSRDWASYLTICVSPLGTISFANLLLDKALEVEHLMIVGFGM